jgi:hypothetical protein
MGHERNNGSSLGNSETTIVLTFVALADIKTVCIRGWGRAKLLS